MFEICIGTSASNPAHTRLLQTTDEAAADRIVAAIETERAYLLECDGLKLFVRGGSVVDPVGDSVVRPRSSGRTRRQP